MARKATVDIGKVREMLREGLSTQAVAEHFGVSRQAIDLHRRKFIQNGELENRRAPRVASSISGYDAGSPTMQPVQPSLTAVVPLDRLIELVIEAFDSLKKVPVLEDELKKYKRDYEKACQRIDQLEKEIGRRFEQEARWKQAAPSSINPT